MISPYLNQPTIPLAVALPRMLEKIEAELVDRTVSTAEKWRLRKRAQLVRELLTPTGSPNAAVIDPAGAGADRAPPV